MSIEKNGASVENATVSVAKTTPAASETFSAAQTYIFGEIKAFAKHPLVIVAAVLFALSAIPFIVPFTNLVENVPLLSKMYGWVGGIKSLIWAFDIVMCLVDLGLLVGILIVAFSNKATPRTDTLGFSVIKIAWTVRLVIYIFFELMIPICLLSISKGYSPSLSCYIPLIMCCLAIPFTAVFHIMAKSVVSDLQESAELGIAAPYVINNLFIILCFVFGAFELVTLSTTGICTILLGVFLIKFREKMRAVKKTSDHME